MSKLFKYLNLTEADMKLLDPETIKMGEVVDIMQKTYISAPDGRKKDVLANLIAETVVLVLVRVNAVNGLSKNAQKKIEEEAKELPKAPKMPKASPKQEAPKEQPKKEEPPKEQENPFKEGQIWFNKTISYKMEIAKIIPESDTLKVIIIDPNNMYEAYYALELALEKVEKGDWKLLEEEKKPEQKQEESMPEDEPETEEEIKNAISGLSLLAKMGDDEAKIEIKRLKAKLKKK
jgi:hypothetical protein